MNITYRTNHATTTKSLTEWYFGKEFVKGHTDTLLNLNRMDGRTEIKAFQKGTGFLTVKIN